MMKLPIGLSVVVALFVALCAGDAVPPITPTQPPSAPMPEPVAPAHTALTVSPGPVASHRPEVLDVSADGQHVALRVRTARDVHSEHVARCEYPGLNDGVDGVQLVLVRFDEQTVQSWTVYRTPTENDETCTSEDDASAQLTQAKAAFEDLGLDSTEQMAWRDAPGRDTEPVRATIAHASDSGYHTYTATVTSAMATATVVHSPNPAMGGQGTLQARGTLTGDFGAAVIFEATRGPAGIWSDWMLTPPL